MFRLFSVISVIVYISSLFSITKIALSAFYKSFENTCCCFTKEEENVYFAVQYFLSYFPQMWKKSLIKCCLLGLTASETEKKNVGGW